MVSSYQLIKRIHLDDIKSNEWSLEGTDATIINYLLRRTHIVKGCEVDNITDFCKINKWINEPTHTDRALELHWLLS